MKAKHSPGPWRRQKRSSTDAIVDADGDLVGEVYGRSAGQSMLCTANANLIAASPTLYEACKHALAALENPYELDDQDAIDALAKAIALADGRAS
jgi:hypothetical protein